MTALALPAQQGKGAGYAAQLSDDSSDVSPVLRSGGERAQSCSQSWASLCMVFVCMVRAARAAQSFARTEWLVTMVQEAARPKPRAHVSLSSDSESCASSASSHAPSVKNPLQALEERLERAKKANAGHSLGNGRNGLAREHARAVPYTFEQYVFCDARGCVVCDVAERFGQARDAALNP